MTDCISLVFSFWDAAMDLLFSSNVEFFGYTVSIGSIIFCFIVIGMVAGMFFKGAKG